MCGVHCYSLAKKKHELNALKRPKHVPPATARACRHAGVPDPAVKVVAPKNLLHRGRVTRVPVGQALQRIEISRELVGRKLFKGVLLAPGTSSRPSFRAAGPTTPLPVLSHGSCCSTHTHTHLHIPLTVLKGFERVLHRHDVAVEVCGWRGESRSAALQGTPVWLTRPAWAFPRVTTSTRPSQTYRRLESPAQSFCSPTSASAHRIRGS